MCSVFKVSASGYYKWLRSIVKKRYKVTTNSSHQYSVVENVLNRAFRTTQENAVWVSRYYLHNYSTRLVICNNCNR